MSGEYIDMKAERGNEHFSVEAELEQACLAKCPSISAEGLTAFGLKFIEDEEERARKNYIGAFVNGYALTEIVGRGGMGTVYRGERVDGVFKRSAAVKVMTTKIDDYIYKRLFMLEREILASLSHPNIAGIYDGGIMGDGQPFFVMEFIEGETLEAFLSKRKPSRADRIKLFSDICLAIEHAHERRIIHRDIKPSNIIVRNDNVVKVLDFGVAKRMDGKDLARKTGRPLTFRYASPEQLNEKPETRQSDIYQLGLLLYFFLFGRHFRADHITSTEISKFLLPERLPNSINDDGMACKILMKCLGLHNYGTYQTAGEVAHDTLEMLKLF